MNTASFFNDYYKKAGVNCILIMDCDGVILDLNSAFTSNFGYSLTDLKGKNFSVLFNKRDNEKNKPGLEVESAVATGQANDENYLIDKAGRQVWCFGEIILVTNAEGKNYLVKDILNLNEKKQLQLFLADAEQLLQKIFSSAKGIPMIVLDGSMKIQKVNPAFLQLFEMDNEPLAGSRITDMGHMFWDSVALKNELRTSLVTGEPVALKNFPFQTKAGAVKTIMIDTKIIDRQPGAVRHLYILLDEV